MVNLLEWKFRITDEIGKFYSSYICVILVKMKMESRNSDGFK